MSNSSAIYIRFLTAILLFFCCASPLYATLPEHSFNPQRAKILGYIVSQHLMHSHYSHKSLDDKLSEAAFELYIKQLDSQKRFLLQKDVKLLSAYEHYIDDEIGRGQIHLPVYSHEIMTQRIPVVKKMIMEILAHPFDMQRKEEMETDAKKLDFCKDDNQLRERWRKTLKYQVADRFLDLKDEQNEKLKNGAKTKEADSKPFKAKTDAELLEQARKKTAERYTHLFSRMLQESTEDHFERYLNAIARAHDPHTMYLPPAMKEDFDIHMRGSLEGIGALLREDGGYIKVVSIIPGGAAEQEGELESEDTILKVAEGDGEPVDLIDARIRDAVALIRGPKGTEVRLYVKKPDGSHKVISIIREVIQIKETFVKSTVLENKQDGKRYGYVRIPSFYRDFKSSASHPRNVTDDTRAELRKLAAQNISGLILDLRGNGGGSLLDAVDTTGLFIKQGPVVQVSDSGGGKEVLDDRDPHMQYAGPLVVLVDKFSASASEILAGALQDYHRAVIVGSKHTHGKGTVQAVIDLDSKTPMPSLEKFKPMGALKITVQKFYRVSGASTQYRGILADIVLPDRFEAIKSGEKYLDYSMPWDTISKCDYTPQGSPLPLDKLRKNSAERIRNSKKMQQIVKMAQKTRARIEHTKRSLLLKDISAERKELLAEDKLDEDSTLPPHANGDKKKKGVKKKKDWRKRVKKDPYVIEAMAILHDLHKLQQSAAAPTQGN